jgi:hypothetical protein
MTFRLYFLLATAVEDFSLYWGDAISNFLFLLIHDIFKQNSKKLPFCVHLSLSIVYLAPFRL